MAKSQLDWISAVGAVDKIRASDKKRKLFGAGSHRYKFHPPVTNSRIAAFEKKYGIRLPRDYRTFLVDVGNGGAGPFYGIFKLGEMDDGHGHASWKEGEFVGTLKKPWPHRKAWNLSESEREPPEIENDLQHEAWRKELERKYWNADLVAGAIPICHEGGAYRNWLVVTGPEAGYVWHDARADDRGLRPVPGHHKSGKRSTFVDFYRDWLQEYYDKCRLGKLPRQG